MNTHYHDYQSDIQERNFIQSAESSVHLQGGDYLALELAKRRALDDLFAFRREGFHSEHVHEVNRWVKDDGHHHYHGHHGEHKVISDCPKPRHEECQEQLSQMTPESHPYLFVDCAERQAEVAAPKEAASTETTSTASTVNSGSAA